MHPNGWPTAFFEAFDHGLVVLSKAPQGHTFNMYNKLVFQGFKDSDLRPADWSRISQSCKQYILTSPNDLNDSLTGADGLLVKLGSTVDQSIFERAPALKIVGMFGTGYGRIDINGARRRNINVFNISDYATDGVAEFVFGALLSQIRELPRALNSAAGGDYSEASFSGTQLRGKSIGILGLGNIGRRVAAIAANGFGMKVHYWSRRRKREAEGATLSYASIDQILSTSDIISLHMALTPETDGFLSPDRVRAIPNGSLIVNTAPMELIDYAAIENRLSRATLSLILDHSDEMSPADVGHLSSLPHCVVYPPIAYVTAEAALKKQSIFVDNIVAGSRNKPLPNLVN